MSFEAEADDILRELLREPGARGAVVAREGAEPGEARRHPLGQGVELVVAVDEAPPAELGEAIERAARELRSAIRRHGLTEVPEVRLAGRMPRSREALLRKVRDLIGALAAMHGAPAAVLLRGPEILATYGDLDDAHRAQLSFLRKRLDAEAARSGGRSSHAELSADDFYARSFWFDAYLFLFFAHAGWSLDFVRYRARAVTRELSAVLPHLENDPTTPANVRPLPPRG